MDANSTTQAFIVPVGAENTVFLGHAVSYWEQLLYELLTQHSEVHIAVNTANTALLARGKDKKGRKITEQWQNIGGDNVQIH